MNETIANLTELPGVSMAAIVRRDGSVEAATREDAAHGVLASLSSAIFQAVAGALAKGGIGTLDACLFEAGNQAIQIHGAGDRVLVALTSNDANLGRVKLALRRAAERVASQ